MPTPTKLYRSETFNSLPYYVAAASQSESLLNENDDTFDNYIEDSALGSFYIDSAAQHEEENWKKHLSRELRFALNKLDHISKDVLIHRWLTQEKATLDELANRHNLSRQDIRQLEAITLDKLRYLMAPATLFTF
ncbi:sigma factor-like helix-turn-helix DNA-binding protein [Vibrio echinoideorum]|uniref:sigma factor-like helix-turn-helix DNA-binding protein n=1 Tax=Vibrio echinoideorum TaxID=2100116 RepID=UPI00354F0610